MATTNDAQHPSPLVGVPAHITDLLKRLHKQSEEQEANFSFAAIPKDADSFRTAVADKFIALDEDKSQFMYQLARAAGARNIVEAGTSYGVSTIYLALAAAANAAALGGTATVIGTEHEPPKAAQARAYWAECGDSVAGVIDLREGDLQETLKVDMPQVDMLLLDIWTPMALPALKLCEPHFRPGAIILADNTQRSAAGYEDLFAHVRREGSGYASICVPYSHGFEMIVYYPPKK